MSKQTPRCLSHLLPLKAHLALAACVMQMFSSAHAQTVYRCGDQYSTHAQCSKAAGTPLLEADHGGTAKAQHAQTLQTQKEADALEKHRLQAERQALQGAMKAPLFAPDNAPPPYAVMPEPVAKTQGKRRVASPYFSAKESGPPNKAAAKTSTKKNRSAATP